MRRWRGCRSPSRTSTTWPAFAPPTDRRSMPTMCPTARTSWSSGWSSAAPWSWRSRTRPSSAPAATPSTRCSARPATRGTHPAPAAARLVAPRPRWPAARCGWRPDPTWAAACAPRPGSAASWESGPAPAGFCGVVGIRPSPGRVSAGPAPLPFETMSVEGPMGRTVADAALMLDAMTGLDPRDPLSLEAPEHPFAAAAAAPALPLRVAYSPDLGVTPVAAEVRDACGRAAERLAAAGVEVEEASPDLTGAPEAFQILRGAGFVAGMEPLYATDRDRLKPDIIWNIEFGLSLSVERIAQAEQARGAIFQRMSKFMAGYDLLLCPTACVAPFDVSTRWIREVSGVTFDNYVDWLRITSAITLTSCPVVALPCELTDEGLPVGMQLVGRPRGEWRLLAAAAAVEQVFDLAGRVPMDPRGG